MIRKFKYLAIGLSFAAFSGMASASTTACETILRDISNGSCNASCAASYKTSQPECFPGGAAPSAQQIMGTSFQMVSAVSSALSGRFLGSGPVMSGDAKQQTGMAAGGASQRWNVWVSDTGSSLKYDASSLSAGSKSTSNVNNFVLGGDYRFSPSLVAGVSAAIDNGSGNLQGTQSVSTNGYSIAPYLGWQINKNWALDASIGWGAGKGTVAGNSKTDSDRFFLGSNLSYTQWFGKWQVAGKGSYLSSVEDVGDVKYNGTTAANTASKNKLDQLRLGVEAGYWMNGFMPYAGIAYSQDLRRSSSVADSANAPWDKSAFVFTLGANFFSLSNNVTGGIAYNQEASRSYSKNSSLTANINFRF